MSEIKNKIASFLDDGGRGLGFDEHTLPELNDFQIIIQQMITIWDYNGMTETEYYGGSKKKLSNFKSVGRIIKENKMDEIDYWESIEDSIIDSMENR